MWEALFVTTFQNKDNLLIYTTTICKSFKQNAEKYYFFILYYHFLTNTQKITYNAAFIFIHLFICVAVNLAKSYI